MVDYTELVNKEFTFLGDKCRAKGEFHFSGRTRLASRIEGEVHMENKSELCLETESHVTGTIYCHNIEIYGHFEGSLKATGKVTIYAPAVVKGVIDANSLLIYPGAILNIDGHTRHNS